MAFTRYATAVVTQKDVSQKGWGKVRKAAANPTRNLVAQASEILGKPFSPDNYLLTHCTIVASVDVDEVPNVKLGRVKVGSKTINRKYADYYIKPECSQYVNNNGDSWNRNVLLMAYPSFVGSHNFLEHIQIEEQSKGRIIDAVARDIGDSVYVDILVATDRKHEQLVKDIESGKIATLSMGCTVDETICTKCGNVAVDETELCDCIKFHKLDHFYDEAGQKRVIAELCGHPSLGDDGGVQFIEASWVATPAFAGAVMRNILEMSSMPESMARRIQAVMEQPPAEWDATAQQKAASGQWNSMARTQEQLRTGQWGDEEEEKAPAEEAKGPLETLQNEIYDAIVEKVKGRVLDDLKKQEVEEALSPEESSAAPNDTIIKEANLRQAAARAYRGAVTALMRTASSDVEFIDSLVSLNKSFGVEIEREIYRASLKVGSLDSYSSMERFVGACQRALARPITPADLRVMIRIGKMLTQMGSTNPPSTRR
jgi:hypothetical protein